MAIPAASPDIVVIGGSAGSIEALHRLAASLPKRFPAAVLVVVHLPADSRSYLPEILTRAGPLRATHARDGEPLEGGRVYVAPPNHHMLIRDGHVRLTLGPRENGHRPSIDALFRSAAQWHGSHTAGVLLSGALSDGVDGLWAIKSRGGTAIVQDPAEALFASMPAGAIERLPVDYTLPAREIGPVLSALNPIDPAEVEPVPAPASNDELEEEQMDDVSAGVPSVFACPDCGGVLWELKEGEMARYRCRVGHAYSPEGLDESQQHHIEDALWAALRALDENTELSARLAERSRQRGLDAAARRFEERADTSRNQSDMIRSAIETLGDGNRDLPAAPEPLRGDVAIEREHADRREQAGS